jgi:hypothetical protein
VETLHAAALKFQPIIRQLLQPEVDSGKETTEILQQEDSLAKYRVELGGYCYKLLVTLYFEQSKN